MWKKFTSFCQVLKWCTLKTSVPFFLPHGVFWLGNPLSWQYIFSLIYLHLAKNWSRPPIGWTKQTSKVVVSGPMVRVEIDADEVDVIEACYESHKYIVFCHYNSYTQLSRHNISRSTQPSTCRNYRLLSWVLLINGNGECLWCQHYKLVVLVLLTNCMSDYHITVDCPRHILWWKRQPILDCRA